MTARNQTVVVSVPNGEVQVTLIVAVNPYFPDLLCYDVYLPDGKPAGRVSRIIQDRLAGTGRWVNRTVSRSGWQPTTNRGLTLAAHPTRASALRSLICAVGA